MIPIGVAVAGLVVVVGHFTDNQLLTRLWPTWVTMKFSTAVCFLALGLGYAFMLWPRTEQNVARTMAMLMTVIMVMGLEIFSHVMGFDSPIDQMSASFDDITGIVAYTRQGEPSLATMTAFIIAGFGGMLWVSGKNGVKLKSASLSVGTIGAIGLLGYFLDEPRLYFAFEEVSGAMALHTSLAFIAIGITGWQIKSSKLVLVETHERFSQ